MKWSKHVGVLMVLTAMLWAMGGAVSSYAASLDQNEEVQSVMGDISALKTAAQMYYSDNGSNSRVPPLSSILCYFDEGSLPRDASSLYAIKGDAGAWYVGYRAYGLQSETYRQLEVNANSLGLVGDDLRSPWRRGSSYIWSSALAVSGSSSGSSSSSAGTTVIRDSSASDTAVGVAAVLVGAAAILSIVNNYDRTYYYYSYPEQPWRWRSSLMYHPAYRDRFYRSFSQSRPRPAPVRPAPIYRKPPELRPPYQQSPRQQSPRQQAPRLRSEPRRDASRQPRNNPPARFSEKPQRPRDNRPPLTRRRTEVKLD